MFDFMHISIYACILSKISIYTHTHTHTHIHTHIYISIYIYIFRHCYFTSSFK